MKEAGYLRGWRSQPSLEAVATGIMRWMRTDGVNADTGRRIDSGKVEDWYSVPDSGNLRGILRAIKKVMRE